MKTKNDWLIYSDYLNSIGKDGTKIVQWFSYSHFLWIEPGSFSVVRSVETIVTVTKGFFIQKNPVTAGDWKKLKPNDYFGSLKDSDPCAAVYRSKEQILAFIAIYGRHLRKTGEDGFYLPKAWLTKLPTEAEWVLGSRHPEFQKSDFLEWCADDWSVEQKGGEDPFSRASTHYSVARNLNERHKIRDSFAGRKVGFRMVVHPQELPDAAL